VRSVISFDSAFGLRERRIPPAANVAKVCRKKHSQRDRDVPSMVGEAEALDIPAVNLAPRRQEWGINDRDAAR
jgi:hypothetical protein